MSVLRFAPAFAALALALPASAQTSTTAGPYILMDANRTVMSLAAGRTVAKRGSIGRVTGVFIFPRPSADYNNAAVVEIYYQVHCQGDVSLLRAAYYDMSGAPITPATDDKKWHDLSTESVTAGIKDFVCTGAVSDGAALGDDFGPVAADYREWALAAGQ